MGTERTRFCIVEIFSIHMLLGCKAPVVIIGTLSLFILS